MMDSLTINKELTCEDIGIEDIEMNCSYAMYGKNSYDSVFRFFEANKLNTAFLNDCLSSKQPIAILKNLNVDESSRGEGYGHALMSEFIWECDKYKANALLIADLAESNDFCLKTFYEQYGFKVLDETHNDAPVMFRIRTSN